MSFDFGERSHPGCCSVRPRTEPFARRTIQTVPMSLFKIKCRPRGALGCARRGRAPQKALNVLCLAFIINLD